MCRIIKAINRKKNQQTRARTNEKKATFVPLGVSYSTGYDLRKKTSYSAHIPLLWLLTGDFRLAKGDVKRMSFFHVNGRFVRYLNPFFGHWGHPHFFLRLPSNAFPDIGSAGRIEKKNPQYSRNSRPWYPKTTLKVNIHIFGLTKCTIYCEKCSCFVPVFLYAVTILIFQIKRIISSEKWCNYVVTFSFWKCQKFVSVGRR